MTLEQVQYFLVAAEQLNFTKAAEICYTNQPTFSRQIAAIEKELELKLFRRGNRFVRLTPAGAILYQRLKDVSADFSNAVAEAQNVEKGINGKVCLGILDGIYVGDFMPDLIEHFRETYPQLEIILEHRSFSGLTKGLADGSLDLVFTIEFHLQDVDQIIYNVLEQVPDNLVCHRSHPLFDKTQIRFEDLDGQHIILISPDDLPLVRNLLLPTLEEKGVKPIIHFAPDLQTAMLWGQSGIGALYFSSRCSLIYDPNMKFLEFSTPWNTGFVVGWSRTNYNASVPLISEYCNQEFPQKMRNAN